MTTSAHETLCQRADVVIRPYGINWNLFQALFELLRGAAGEFFEIAVKCAEIPVTAQTVNAGDTIALPDIFAGMPDAAAIEKMVKGLPGNLGKQRGKAALGYGAVSCQPFQGQFFSIILLNIGDATQNGLPVVF